MLRQFTLKPCAMETTGRAIAASARTVFAVLSRCARGELGMTRFTPARRAIEGGAMVELTDRRSRILHSIVPQVVPSTYGEAKFKRIDSTWMPGSGYTTCGGLPAFVAGQLGLSDEVRREGI